ncbi:hypothetical protein HMPREF3156_02404 [Neisseria sp. HMSC06F02]|nr:hypothetical protein HMPREF3156_02404 [Neisseria sp. HMSC06F02]
MYRRCIGNNSETRRPVFRRPFHLSARLSRYNSRFRYFQTTSFL